MIPTGTFKSSSGTALCVNTGLGRIMAKRADTSESVIGTIILVMNLEKVLRDLFWAIFRGLVDFLRCTNSPGFDGVRRRNRVA